MATFWLYACLYLYLHGITFCDHNVIMVFLIHFFTAEAQTSSVTTASSKIKEGVNNVMDIKLILTNLYLMLCPCLFTASLSIDNYREVFDLTWPYRSRWMFIGVQLGIDQGTLDAIEKDYRHVSDCLRRLISHWLNNVDPIPTRSAINKAIQSDCVRGKILIYLLQSFST